MSSADHQDPQAGHLASPETERNILAAYLRGTRLAIQQELRSRLKPSDFTLEAHQVIWQGICALDDSGLPFDVPAVADWASRANLNSGGASYLVSLAKDDVRAAASDQSLRSGADRILELARKRQIHAEAMRIAQAALAPDTTSEQLATQLADAAEASRTRQSSRSTGPEHISSLVASNLEMLEALADQKVRLNVVPTGISGWDDLLGGGLFPGLHVVAGRPSMGKTAMANTLQTNAGVGDCYSLMFSTEQRKAAMTNRMLASESRIEAGGLRTGQLADHEWSRLTEGAAKLGEKNIWIDDESEMTLPLLRSRTRVWIRQRLEQHEAKYAHLDPQDRPAARFIVFIDYLQRMTSHLPTGTEPRQVIGSISTGLAQLAGEINSPVVALAQLNRGVEQRANKRPMMSDLAETGKIEQDADGIYFLYRDEYYNPDTKTPGVAEVITAKQRDGRVGVALASFHGNTQRFEGISDHAY